MIMCTLFSMFYGLFKPFWIIVSCTCFKETTPLFNVHLSCFVGFILCPTDKYMLKVNKKKNLINLLNIFKIKSKCSMASFRCIYCWPWPHAAYQYSVSTFNFNEAFVSSVEKASHNVLQKKRDICLLIKVGRPISFNGLSLHRTEISYEYLTTLQL